MNYCQQIQNTYKPIGRFVIGGPQGDSGLTGRKLLLSMEVGVGMEAVRFPEKIPVKWIALQHICVGGCKNIVAAELAEKLKLNCVALVTLTNQYYNDCFRWKSF